MIRLTSCPKGYVQDLDKAITPQETIARVRQRLNEAQLDILAHTKRVDTGRLGIPVFLSVCGQDARRIMPTRKQMGKGSSAAQAEASALMELMERYAFFSFWEREFPLPPLSWSKAEKQLAADTLIPLREMLASVQDSLSEDAARRILDLHSWLFYPATSLTQEREVWLPLDWFKLLSEFNGTAAGNTREESLLQGICELVERHVCAIVDREHTITPTIAHDSIEDPTLQALLNAFAAQNIHLVLKDFSLNMPVPTIGALAWDATTLGKTSEIVFTAGTAASPAKAAIRAVTEVAQLAGDFHTGACYEASGLSKFTRLQDIEWLLQGEFVSLSSLPSVEKNDIRDEVLDLAQQLEKMGYPVYAVETTHPLLDIPAHYCMIPGFSFRERDTNQSLGLFVGRKLVEEESEEKAQNGLAELERHYPNAHFLPFFKGMLALRKSDLVQARACFTQAIPLQPDTDAQALATFYLGYAWTLENQWTEAIPFLQQASQLCPDMKEYGNLYGVALFKTQEYAKAATVFEQVLTIDKGSIMDIANLGLCHKFLGDTAQARHYLGAALELDPTLEFARVHLSELDALHTQSPEQESL